MPTSKAVVEYLSGAASAAPFPIAEKRRSPNNSFLYHFTGNRFHAGNPLHSSCDCRRCLYLRSVFCGCVLGVCGVWVGCVVFFVVAETAARQLEVSCLVVGCVGGWGGGSFTVCCFPVCGACLRLAGCGVRVSACCTCWCAGFWCAWFMCVRVLCENSIVCQCTFVLVAAGATGVVVVALIIMTRLFIT